jgi:FAD/FMN-containing dehydrogenase
MQRYIEDLKKELGEKKVLNEDFEVYVYGADWSPRTPEEIFPPEVVIQPKTTEDVQKAVQIAKKNKIPVTVGAGLTGMAGGAVPLYGGIYIDSTTMSEIIEIDVPNQIIRCQAGITLQKLNEALEPHGLWFPNLPESKWSCTVGASIGCDNDSTFGMKYGKILNSLLSAQLVDGNGEILELGHRKARFTSTGYKLKDILVGSEGTLGVVTEATLKVEPIPKYREVNMILFPSMKSSVEFLSRLLQAGICPEGTHINCKRRLKFYTHAYRQKYGKDPEVPEWAEALMALIFSGDESIVKIHRDYAFELASKYKGQPLKEREIVDGWWISKHTLEFEPFKQKWPDSQRVKKFGAADPGIPMGRLEEFYKEFINAAEKNKLDVLGMNAYLEHPFSIGFSLSCALFVDYRDKDEVERFRRYFKDLTKRAVDFEGTMSTYMSDTDLKVENFEYEHGASAGYMQKIKQIFDPCGIMNPGKKFKYEGPQSEE